MMRPTQPIANQASSPNSTNKGTKKANADDNAQTSTNFVIGPLAQLSGPILPLTIAQNGEIHTSIQLLCSGLEIFGDCQCGCLIKSEPTHILAEVDNDDLLF